MSAVREGYLNGKVAVVTGGCGGIGTAVCTRLQKEGATVYIDTPMLKSFFGSSGNIESLQQAVRDVHPLGTYGQPEDVANLVNWLAGDEARYASGQLWVLDGGPSAQVQQMRL